MRNVLLTLCRAALAAGTVFAVIGLYLLVVKAGIPYQDPTPEMTARWMSAYQAGRRALTWGVGLLAAGGIVHFLCRKR